MPMYSYRREDGTTFEIRQKFLDDPLLVDPETGQKVTRIVHAAGVIFKGSGFYVTDNKGAGNSAAPVTPANSEKSAESSSSSENKASSESKTASSENGSKSSENGSKSSENGSKSSKSESNAASA